MIAIIFNSEAEANRFQTLIDQDLGYPKHGILRSGGIHISCDCNLPDFSIDCPNVTKTYSEVIKHPTLDKWAYPIDETVHNSRVNFDGSPEPLDSGWAVD